MTRCAVTVAAVLLICLHSSSGQQQPYYAPQAQQPQFMGPPQQLYPSLIITAWPGQGPPGGLSEIAGRITGLDTGAQAMKALLFVEQSLGSWSLAGFKPIMPDGSFSFAVPDASWPQARIYILPAAAPVTPLLGGALPSSLDAMAVLAASYARNYVPHQLQQPGVQGAQVQGIGQQGIGQGQYAAAGQGQAFTGAGPAGAGTMKGASVGDGLPAGGSSGYGSGYSGYGFDAAQAQAYGMGAQQQTPEPVAQAMRTPPPTTWSKGSGPIAQPTVFAGVPVPGPAAQPTAVPVAANVGQPQQQATHYGDYRDYYGGGGGAMPVAPPNTLPTAPIAGVPGSSDANAGIGGVPVGAAPGSAGVPSPGGGGGGSGASKGLIIGVSVGGGLIAMAALAVAGVVLRRRWIRHKATMTGSVPTSAEAHIRRFPSSFSQRQHRSQLSAAVAGEPLQPLTAQSASASEASNDMLSQMGGGASMASPAGAAHRGIGSAVAGESSPGGGLSRSRSGRRVGGGGLDITNLQSPA